MGVLSEHKGWTTHSLLCRHSLSIVFVPSLVLLKPIGLRSNFKLTLKLSFHQEQKQLSIKDFEVFLDPRHKED